MITVTHESRDRLRVSVRDHDLFTDQPLEDGGADTAPTPTELFVAGLAACVAFYAERYLRRHGLSVEDLRVTCDYRWAENPHRVGQIDVVVDAPGLPADRREPFERVIDRCTVHNTLRQAPAIQVRMAQAAALPAA